MAFGVAVHYREGPLTCSPAGSANQMPMVVKSNTCNEILYYFMIRRCTETEHGQNITVGLFLFSQWQ